MKTILVWVLMAGMGVSSLPAAPAAPSAAKAAEPEAKIEGQVVARSSGGYLGIAVVDGNFRISFYDAAKKPVVADVERAMLHWPVRYKRGDEFAVLNQTSDGKALTSDKIVRPPLSFRLYISLTNGEIGSDTNTEDYVITFQG